MKKLHLSIIFLNLIAVISAMGQSLQPTYKSPTPKDLVLKVSQFSQFVKRFNYEEDFWGNNISKSFTDKINRNDYISLLFNNEDERLDSISKGFSPPYQKLKEELIQKVVANNYRINRASDSLYSVSVCEVIYKNKTDYLKLVMKQELINHGIAWVITDVAADFLYDEDNISGSGKFIPPTSNEVNYIHLENFFEHRDSLASYAYKGYTCNRLSIFFQLLYSGDIRYKYVRSVTYFISDVPGWLIQVQEYNRKGTNSGWLIKEIAKNKKPVKEYISSIIHLEK